MRALLDSNAYSRLMRGDEQTAAVGGMPPRS